MWRERRVLSGDGEEAVAAKSFSSVEEEYTQTSDPNQPVQSVRHRRSRPVMVHARAPRILSTGNPFEWGASQTTTTTPHQKRSINHQRKERCCSTPDGCNCPAKHFAIYATAVPCPVGWIMMETCSNMHTQTHCWADGACKSIHIAL